MDNNRKPQTNRNKSNESKGRIVAFNVLKKYKRGFFVEKILNDILPDFNLDQRERSLALELINGVFRWQKKLDFIIKQLVTFPKKKIEEQTLILLRLGIYQLFLTDKIPEYAAVNTVVDIAKSNNLKTYKFINAILRKAIRNKNDIKYPPKDSVEYISTFYSHPSWLVEKWIKKFGIEDTKQLCKNNNKPPTIYIRANTRYIEPHKLHQSLTKQGVSVNTPKGNYMVINNPSEIRSIQEIKTGKIYVQNPASGFVVDIMGLKGNETVLDLCAAPGGKTSDIYQRLDKGILIASEISIPRLKIMQNNFKRMQFEPNVIAQNGLSPSLKPESFDTILIDAPCSNTGVLNKRVESRWEKTFADLKKLYTLQYNLLKKSAKLLKVGGVIVYSTCSLEPEENNNTIEIFLKAHPNFSLEKASDFVPKEYTTKEGYMQILPHTHGLEGLFVARIKKQ